MRPAGRKRGHPLRTVKKPSVRLEHDLDEAPPEDWDGEIDQVVAPGGVGFSEVVSLHRSSRTVMLAGLIDNLEASRLPFLTRLLTGTVGALAPDGKAPIYLRQVVKLRRKDAAAAVEKVIAREPERVIIARGMWFASTAGLRLTAARCAG